MMDLLSPFLKTIMIFWFIPSQEAKAKCPEKVANKWNWVLEALWVSVPLLGSIKVTFALNDRPLAASFDEILDFRPIPGAKLEAKGPEKVENKWNWLLEQLGVSVLPLESINMTFT